MAERLFVVDLNLNGNQAKSFRLEDFASNPDTNLFAGRLIHNTSGTDRINFYDGSAWKSLAFTDDTPPLDQDLQDIAALTGDGFLVRQSGVWGMDNSTYLTSETDPIYTASSWYTTTNNSSDWNTAYGWGNHASAGYLTIETDPVYTASSWYTTTNNSSNWDTAYGWGNHASAGYLTSAVTSIANTDGNISFDVSTGSVTANLASSIELSGSLTVQGDLTVNGDVTTLNTATMNIEDNIFLLNSNVTGTPTVNAGLEVERGSYTNASIYWNETANKWYVGTPGDNTDAAVATALSLVGHGHTASDISDFNIAVDTEIDSHLSGSNSISYSSGAIDTTLATTSYLSKTSGLAVDISSLETKLTTDGYPKKYSTTIGDASAQTFTVTHNLGTRAVTVQIFESATPYAQVEAEVLHTGTNTVTINTNNVPTSGQYTVVVVG